MFFNPPREREQSGMDGRGMLSRPSFEWERGLTESSSVRPLLDDDAFSGWSCSLPTIQWLPVDMSTFS